MSQEKRAITLGFCKQEDTPYTREKSSIDSPWATFNEVLIYECISNQRYKTDFYRTRCRAISLKNEGERRKIGRGLRERMGRGGTSIRKRDGVAKKLLHLWMSSPWQAEINLPPTPDRRALAYFNPVLQPPVFFFQPLDRSPSALCVLRVHINFYRTDTDGSRFAKSAERRFDKTRGALAADWLLSWRDK